MASSLSSLADRNFILGFLLPVAFALMLFQFLFPELPLLTGFWSGPGEGSAVTLVAVVLAAWLGAVLLMVINTMLYRLLEGYFGPLANASMKRRALEKAGSAAANLTRLGEAESKARARYEFAQAGFDAWYLAKSDVEDAERKLEAAERDQALALREYHQSYPHPPELALPTDFGNVIRAFETYPLQVYGAEAISAWPRLLAVVPDAYQKLLDNARTEVDFFVNSLFLAMAVGIVALLRLVAALSLCADQSGWVWSFSDWCVAGPDLANTVVPVVYILALPPACLLFYRLAVSRAGDWGIYVRSAFDLYLPALAGALAHKLPADALDKRIFWYELTQSFLENRPIDSRKWPPPSEKA